MSPSVELIALRDKAAALVDAPMEIVMQPWVSTAIGLIVQAVLLAYFLGKMKGWQDFTSKIVDQLLARMAAFDSERTAAAALDARVAARLDHLEVNTQGLQGLGGEMIRLGTLLEAHTKRYDQDAEAARRNWDAVQRQLAGLANPDRQPRVIEYGRPSNEPQDGRPGGEPRGDVLR